MTYEEMSNFTHEELSNFGHLELSLKNTELLQKIINDFREDIPSRIILKLESICKNFITFCESNNIEIPVEVSTLKNKKHFTFLEILSILGTVITIISFVIDMFSSEEKTVNNAYINQVTNYVITEEYITNIDTIINELEQTYNISINIEDTSNDSDSENWFHHYVNCI